MKNSHARFLDLTRYTVTSEPISSVFPSPENVEISGEATHETDPQLQRVPGSRSPQAEPPPGLPGRCHPRHRGNREQGNQQPESQNSQRQPETKNPIILALEKTLRKKAAAREKRLKIRNLRADERRTTGGEE